MTGRRLLVGGIGNVFLGDDGFGVEVARRLQSRPLPAGVEVVDFGIRGIDLAYALADCEAAILVDTVARGGAPGTLYVLEPEPGAAGPIEMHSMTPDRVLGWIDPATAPRVLRVVGCEPSTFGVEGEGQDSLSAPVLAAVDEAVRMVEALVEDLAGGGAARA
jgi:hydrogenase maturation protease